MKSLLLPFLFFVTTPLWAEPPGIDQSSELLTVPAGEKFLRWYGHADRSYFLQVSDPNDHLRKWTWAPIIEGGNDEEISYEVDGTADKGFFRLKYTNQLPGPGETLETADFDLDGLSNLDEISPLPSLFANAATDPLANDTDNDGMNDGFERTFGFNANNADENGNNIPDGEDDNDLDGFSNSAEGNAGTNPNDQNDTPDDPSVVKWIVDTGDAPMGEPTIVTETYTIKKGESRVVVVGTTSDEYPQYTGYESEYDDTLEWEITPSAGEAISGSISVNERHEDWDVDAINGVSLNGYTPVHIEKLKVITAVDSDITVEINLTATNISDDILPSTVIVGLIPLEIVSRKKAPLAELKVGKMHPTVLMGNGLPVGSQMVVALDNEVDQFFVRVKGSEAFTSFKMKFETVNNPNAAYNDDPTEYTLVNKNGYLTTESMVLVSDDIDDDHRAGAAIPEPDNSPDDRTHKIQLGGNFKISGIKLGAADWVDVDVKLPVKKKKTVRVQFVNCTYGIWFLDPCWTTPQIDRVKKNLQERYAQVGIEFDFQPTLTGANVDSDGEMTDSEVPSFDGSVGKIYFPQETKDLIDHGPPNDLHNTLMIYLVNKLGKYGGIATPPKYVESFNVRFHNKVLLANEGLRDFTSCHEALHVLTDAAHEGAPGDPYYDFGTERGDQHTIWSETLYVPPFISEIIRRDNVSIGATKRISLAQETAAQSSPLAK